MRTAARAFLAALTGLLLAAVVALAYLSFFPIVDCGGWDPAKCDQYWRAASARTPARGWKGPAVWVQVVPYTENCASVYLWRWLPLSNVYVSGGLC